MKTLVKILAVAMIACLVTSCEKDLPDYSFPAEVQKASTFLAEFIVTDVSDLPVETMSGLLEEVPIEKPFEVPVEKPVRLIVAKPDANFPRRPPHRPPHKTVQCLRTWAGTGESALMGEISVKMTVLCNKSNLSFNNLIGTMEAEDGSVLFFSIANGIMECNTGKGCDYYDLTFNNMAVINGGTGRFAGATGNFYPNALIHNGQGSNWNARFTCNGDLQFMSQWQPGKGGLIQEP